ncbi:hypothetical protein EVA_17897, partial [gut metagenome]
EYEALDKFVSTEPGLALLA